MTAGYKRFQAVFTPLRKTADTIFHQASGACQKTAIHGRQRHSMKNVVRTP